MSSVESNGNVLMHGPTFMANPLACSVANASLDLLLNSPWKQRVLAIEAQLKKELAQCTNLDIVKEIRVLGAIGVVELNRDVDLAWMTKKFIDKGIWIRPFLNLVYIMPPYITSSEELTQITEAIYDVVKEFAAYRETSIK